MLEIVDMNKLGMHIGECLLRTLLRTAVITAVII